MFWWSFGDVSRESAYQKGPRSQKLAQGPEVGTGCGTGPAVPGSGPRWISWTALLKSLFPVQKTNCQRPVYNRWLSISMRNSMIVRNSSVEGLPYCPRRHAGGGGRQRQCAPGLMGRPSLTHDRALKRIPGRVFHSTISSERKRALDWSTYANHTIKGWRDACDGEFQQEAAHATLILKKLIFSNLYKLFFPS